MKSALSLWPKDHIKFINLFPEKTSIHQGTQQQSVSYTSLQVKINFVQLIQNREKNKSHIADPPIQKVSMCQQEREREILYHWMKIKLTLYNPKFLDKNIKCRNSCKPNKQGIIKSYSAQWKIPPWRTAVQCLQPEMK